MKIYDKAEWQIDAGIDKSLVTEHFKLIFGWLNKNGLLNDDGKEIYQLNSFGDISLHNDLLTDEGCSFIEKNYDEIARQFRYGSLDFINALKDRLQSNKR